MKAGGSGVIYDVGSWRLGDDGSIHRRGRLKYANGDIYDGEWVNGKRHGKGVLKFANGSSYVGEFEDNFFHHFGLLTISTTQHPLTKKWIPGEKYEGEFMKGKKHGKGVAKERNGDVYDGCYADGYYEGKGVCTYANGDVYDGEWSHGKWHGNGELRFRDGSRYVGAFYQSNYHGFGHFFYGSGGKNGSYVGDFVQGKRHGKGVRVFGGKDGKTYEGAWEDNEPHGIGVIECASYKFVGHFARGKKCGHGAMSLENGESYEGNFMDGFFHGHGKYIYSDGGVYEGTFVKSKRQGRGKRVFRNNDSYDGEWMEDLMHGQGVLTRTTLVKNGSAILVYDGEFCQGVQTGRADISYTFIPANAASQFEWNNEYEFPLHSGFWHRGRGASTYHGEVLRGYFHGQGVLRSPDGKKWSGKWVNGKLNGVGEQIYLPLELEGILAQERQERRAHTTKDVNKKTTKYLGLYRIVKYEGEFVDNVRHGNGQVLYEDGDRLCGQFINGFADGLVKYRFHNSTKERFAEYRQGERKRWLTEEEEVVIRMEEQQQEEVTRVAVSCRQTVIRALIA